MRTTAFGPENGPDMLIGPSDRIRVDDIGHPIRQFMGQFPRVESGTVQFGDDWPGTFIRGDNAAYYATLLKEALSNIDREQGGLGRFFPLDGLLDLLEGSRVQPAP